MLLHWVEVLEVTQLANLDLSKRNLVEGYQIIDISGYSF